jgi:hypothetical protein
LSIFCLHNNFHDIAGLTFSENVDNIDDNPLFVNLEQGDYRLLPDSPYIDKGTADAPELLSTDFEGDLRIIGSAPDIGADEYDPSSPPTTTSTSSTTSTGTTMPVTTTLTTTITPAPTTTTAAISPQPCLLEEIYGRPFRRNRTLKILP